MATRIYVGNLPVKADRKDIENGFSASDEEIREFKIKVIEHDTQNRTALIQIMGHGDGFVSMFNGKTVGNPPSRLVVKVQ